MRGSFPPFEEERSRGKGGRGCVLSANAIGGERVCKIDLSGYNVCLHNRDAPTFALLIPSSGMGARWGWMLTFARSKISIFLFLDSSKICSLDTVKKIRKEINDKMFRAS